MFVPREIDDHFLSKFRLATARSPYMIGFEKSVSFRYLFFHIGRLDRSGKIPGQHNRMLAKKLRPQGQK